MRWILLALLFSQALYAKEVTVNEAASAENPGRGMAEGNPEVLWAAAGASVCLPEGP